MSDDTKPLAEAAAASLESWFNEQAEQAARDLTVFQANKAVLFPVLAAAGISIVTVSFDGGGDSGQIESIDARAEKNEVGLPVGSIDLMRSQWGSDECTVCPVTIEEAIEHLVYELLGQTHGGWEDGEGAYGEFVFDVAAGTISLDHNERYIATETYTHEF